MFVKILTTAILALYPVFVYFALQSNHLTEVALLLALMALTRAWFSKSKLDIAVAVCAVALGAISSFTDSALFLKLYPVCVNGVCLVLFFASLFTDRPMIERFARLRYKQLPPSGITHCRKATQWWCYFFIFNASVALDSAFNRSDLWWTLYNGCIAYILIGLMFLLEWCIRRHTQNKLHD